MRIFLIMSGDKVRAKCSVYSLCTYICYAKDIKFFSVSFFNIFIKQVNVFVTNC